MANSFIYAFLAILLLGVSTAEAKCGLVHQECLRVHQKYASLDVNRCVKMLSSDPRASKVTNLKNLTIIGLELAEKSAGQFYVRINVTFASDRISPELKPNIAEVAKQVKNVYSSFVSARSEAKEDDEFMTANYDVSVVSDFITAAQEVLSKAKGKVAPFFQRSLHELTAFSQINVVLTNDADTGDVV